MSNSTDLMTQMILAQITDLQRRVTQQDGVIAALKAEVERYSGSGSGSGSGSNRISKSQGPGSAYVAQNRDGHRDNHRTVHTTHSAHTSIPLTHTSYGNTNVPTSNKYNDKKKRPQVAKSDDADERAPPIALSALLKDGEKVTLSIGIGKDSNGAFTYTTCSAMFTGGELCVTECEKVASLVGEKSDKPGTLLYKFMTELKNSGHIQRMFKIAPWKLCSVVRDGKTLTLEELKGDM
jgi:hypothetical protein